MSDAATDSALQDLVGRLAAARDAATSLAGRPPLGVRAVEVAPGRRGYLAAFEGPAFVCLAHDLRPEGGLRRAREAASAGLLWEHVEVLVDAEALRALAGAAGRLLAIGQDPGGILGTLETVAARALELAAWRDEPLRAVASLPDLDRGVALHERLMGAYLRFMRASEPLVEAQDALPVEVLDALRALESAAGRAGAAERLADRLAAAMPGCDEGADEIVAAHLTPLAAGDGR